MTRPESGSRLRPTPVATRAELRWYSSPSRVQPMILGEVIASECWLPPALAIGLTNAKSLLDSMKRGVLARARAAANPLEELGSHIFNNRAALKLAELDSLCQLLFSAARPGEQLCWVDVAAGPGGFSEYGMWRTRRDQEARDKVRTQQTPLTNVTCVRIIAVTLRGRDDFRTENFNIDTPIETFQAVYGPDGTGDLHDTAVTEELRQLVMLETAGKGVPLFTADGGIDVSGHESDQELLTLPLVMSQLATGLEVLAVDGTLVCKLFTTVLPATVRTLWMVIELFDQVTMVKPVTSRPGNSEHYLVARGLRDIGRDVMDSRIQALRNASDAMRAGRTILLTHGELPKCFQEWIRKSNNLKAMAQVRSLGEIVQCAKRPTRNAIGYTDVIADCLRQWRLPAKLPKRKRARALWPNSDVLTDDHAISSL